MKQFVKVSGSTHFSSQDPPLLRLAQVICANAASMQASTEECSMMVDVENAQLFPCWDTSAITIRDGFSKLKIDMNCLIAENIIRHREKYDQYAKIKLILLQYMASLADYGVFLISPYGDLAVKNGVELDMVTLLSNNIKEEI